MKTVLLSLLAVFLLIQFPVIGVANEVVVTNGTDDNFEKVELYSELEGMLNEIGLSMSLFADSGIDFETLEMDYTLTPIKASRSTSKSPTQLSLTRKFAQKKFGSAPTAEQQLQTYLLYYLDVKDQDRDAGRVWDKLPYSYYPEYMTESDEEAYAAFISATYGKKYLNLYNSATSAALSVATDKPVELVSQAITNFGINKDTLENVVDLTEFGQGISEFWKEKKELQNIVTIQGFIDETTSMIENKDSFTKAQKEASSKLVKDMIKITAFSLIGFSSVGIYSIVSMYNSSMATMYQDMYDKAALMSLAYTRSLRINLRGYEAMWN